MVLSEKINIYCQPQHIMSVHAYYPFHIYTHTYIYMHITLRKTWLMNHKIPIKKGISQSKKVSYSLFMLDKVSLDHCLWHFIYKYIYTSIISYYIIASKKLMQCSTHHISVNPHIHKDWFRKQTQIWKITDKWGVLKNYLTSSYLTQMTHYPFHGYLSRYL